MCVRNDLLLVYHHTVFLMTLNGGMNEWWFQPTPRRMSVFIYIIYECDSLIIYIKKSLSLPFSENQITPKILTLVVRHFEIKTPTFSGHVTHVAKLHKYSITKSPSYHCLWFMYISGCVCPTPDVGHQDPGFLSSATTQCISYI